MQKIYSTNSEQFCFFDQHNYLRQGACCGFTLTWLSHLPQSLLPTYKLDVAQALQLQRTCYQIAYRFRLPHELHTYPLSLAGLTYSNEFKGKTPTVVLPMLYSWLGMYYLTIVTQPPDASGAGLCHAMGLYITAQECHFLDPAVGLYTLTFNELFAYFSDKRLIGQTHAIKLVEVLGSGLNL